MDSIMALGNTELANCWYDIVITPNLSYTVSEYSLTPSSTDLIQNKPDQNVAAVFKKELEPGTAYKFRVAGLNACGKGAWSEISAFSTCMPGYPGAPSSIKITKANNNFTHISWEPPQISCGIINEYSVYLSVRPAKEENQLQTSGQKRQQLSFVQIYCGTESSCIIDAEVLSKANIDYSSKPAILFRIAAKNDKGYGPATQVRWLQENEEQQSGESLLDANSKRSNSANFQATVKKKKST